MKARNIEALMPIKTGVTKDYGMFKLLRGNRPVSPKHVEEIEKVAEDIKFLCEEIDVNENYEIIDGQHRFEVAKKYGFHVRYAVFEGIGVGECRKLNINQKNWSLEQFVESYAESGNQNYKRLLSLYNKTVKGGRDGLNMKVVASIAKGYFVEAADIKNEKLKISEGEAAMAEGPILYAKKFIPVFEKVGIRSRDILVIIALLSTLPEVNPERLYNRTLLDIDSIHPFSNQMLTVDCFSNVYNFHLVNKVDLVNLWKTKLNGGRKNGIHK